MIPVRPRGQGTKAVHGMLESRRGPLNPPIVQSSTFAFSSAEEMRRYLAGDEELFLYTRYANPTVSALEDTLAALEGADAALALASGMAAITTGILCFARSGEEILASTSLYGGTVRLLRDLFPTLGIEGRFVAPSDLVDTQRLKAAAGPRSRVLVVESPTNPSLEILDLEACCKAARAAGLAVLVDNTFATPILQRPLALGADLVAHSLTKALAGHSDIIGGALVGSRGIVGRARDLMKILGCCMDPHAAYLAIRGLRTLHLRVARQCENALALASALDGHEKVVRVLYPGLPGHPGHEIAARQMSAFGGMVSLVLRGGLPAAEAFYDALCIVTRAASLGGVESLASLPVHTSHIGFTEEQLRVAGVDPGTVRLSVGVEDAADLVADVKTALDAV